MKSFSQLFKKYRLRSEFETIASFSDALAEKGYIYEESIFYHWQKGTRTPTDRKLVLALIKVFIQRKSIQTKEEANEFLEAARFGYMTKEEEQKLNIITQGSSIVAKRGPHISISLVIILMLLGGFTFIYLYLNFQSQRDYTKTLEVVPSAVTEPKKLVIGIDATLEPMEFIENGKMEGYDVDLGNNLAKEMHADIEFRNIIFDDIFNALDQRQINMIISAVTLTKEREQKYDFSNEYLNAGQVIIVKRNNKAIHGVKDLKGKKIATQAGTTNEQEVDKYTSDDLVLRYPDFVQATQALINGNADAIFTDFPNAKGIIFQNPNLKMVGEPFTKEYYGIVFVKGDPSVMQVNNALASLRKKGVLADLEKKWLH